MIKLNAYFRLMRVDKPVGSLLILWPTLSSLWLAANGTPNIKLIIIFVLGTFLMRSASCIINDYADRHLDVLVSRTCTRPLATKEITPKQALILFFALIICAFFLVLQTNMLTIGLSFVGALLALIYPFLKRITNLPQVWLGLAMNWGIVMAYAAQANSIHPAIWVFYCACILWTIVYDCFYAMVDRKEDLQAGIKSIAILFAENDRIICAVLQIMSLLTFALAGLRLELDLWFFSIILVGVGSLFFYQQVLIKDRVKSKCFQAFKNNQWAALLIFVAVLADLYIK